MKLKIMAAAAALVIVSTSLADARPRHRIDPNVEVVGSRPSECFKFPKTVRRWCGCAAAVYVNLENSDGWWNLARHWFGMRRAPPAAGMATVRNGHVNILVSHVSGTIWRAYDPNNGNRALMRNIDTAGMTIVDPHSARRGRLASS